MKHIISFIFLIAIFSFISSCKKKITDVEKLPEITQSARSTLGFLIDGRYCIASSLKPVSIEDPISVEINNTNTKSLRIIARCNGDAYFTYIILDSLSKYSTYIIDDNKNPNVKVTIRDFTKEYCTYNGHFYNFKKMAGVVSITKFDWDAKIIAGLFNFNIENSNCKSISVTEGRFDIKIP